MIGGVAADIDPVIEERLPLELRMDEIRKIPGAPGPGVRGASREYLAAIRARKKALAEINPAAVGGRPRTKFSRVEAERIAMEEMLPDAIRVLREQLKDPDSKIRQSAAVKVIEYVKGKPTQVVQQELSQVTKIVYESAAFHPPEVDAEAIEEAEFLPLPEGDPIEAAS